MEEMEISGFDSSTKTLYCSNTVNDCAIQVTESSVRVVNLLDGGSLVGMWSPPDASTISVAASNHGQLVLVAGGGRTLYYLRVDSCSSELTEVRFCHSC